METIKSKREFEEVFSLGKRANGRLARVICLKGDGPDFNKVAFVAPKRLGNAVYRNRCKRVLREAARQAGLPRRGTKTIILSTGRTASSHPAEVSENLIVLLRRCGVEVEDRAEEESFT